MEIGSGQIAGMDDIHMLEEPAGRRQRSITGDVD
jgi:hypothetical protein